MAHKKIRLTGRGFCLSAACDKRNSSRPLFISTKKRVADISDNVSHLLFIYSLLKAVLRFVEHIDIYINRIVGYAFRHDMQSFAHQFLAFEDGRHAIAHDGSGLNSFTYDILRRKVHGRIIGIPVKSHQVTPVLSAPAQNIGQQMAAIQLLRIRFVLVAL